MGEPTEKIISMNDYFRVRAFRSQLLEIYPFKSLQDEDFKINKAYQRRSSSSIDYFYETISQKPCIKDKDRFTITLKYECGCKNSVAKGWDFKQKEEEEEKDKNDKFDYGQIDKYTPTRDDFNRVNTWKNVILDQCCQTEYRYYVLRIVSAYKQIVNGTNYFYELFPQGSSCKKAFKCTIFQSYGCGQNAPSSTVRCGWGDFNPKEEDLTNIVEHIPRRADHALVEELRDRFLKELEVHYSSSFTLDVEKVYEQVKKGADRIFYKVHPHGSCNTNPLYFTVEVPDLSTEGQIEIKKGWLGFQNK